MKSAALTITPGDRAARRRLHRLGHRRLRHHRARAQGVSRRRPAPHLAVLHSLGHHQPRRRPGVDPVRRQGPELGDGTACSASAHAIGDAAEMIRRGAADAMIAGGSEAAITPMGLGGFARHARALDAQRRAASRRAGRSTRIATASSSAKAPASSSSRRWSTRRRAAPTSTPSSSATACRATPSTSPTPSEDGDGGYRVMKAALAVGGHRAGGRAVHQRARHVDAVQRSHRDAGDQARASAITPTSWRSRRPSR